MDETKKNRFKSALTAFIIVSCLFLIILLLAYISMPYWLTKTILPRISTKLGVACACEIDALSPWKTQIANLAIGKNNFKFVEIKNLALKYDIVELWKEHKIRKFSANDVFVQLIYQNGQIVIPGFVLPKKHDSAPKIQNEPVLYPIIESCEIRNLKLQIVFPENDLRVESVIEISAQHINKDKYQFNGALQFESCKINFSGESDLQLKELKLSFNIDNLKLANFQNLFKKLSGKNFDISGTANINGEYDKKTNLVKLSATLPDFLFQYNTLKIQNDFDCSNIPVPIDISTVFQQNQILLLFNQIKIINSGFEFILETDEPTKTICIEKNSDGCAFSGSLILETMIPSDNDAAYKSSLPFLINFHGSSFSNGNWRLNSKILMKDKEKFGRTFKIKNWKLYLGNIESSINAKGQKNNCKISFSAQSQFDISNGKNIELSVPDSKLFGNFNIYEGKPELMSYAKFAGVSANLNRLKIKKLDALLPFDCPFQENPVLPPILGKHGFISAKKIYFKNFKLGSINAQLAQQNLLSYIFAGEYLPPFKNTAIEFEGDIGKTISGLSATLNASLAKKDEKKQIKLQAISKSLLPVELEGNFDFAAQAKYEVGKLDSYINVSAKETLVKYADDKVKIEGLKFNLQIPDIKNFSSHPGQIMEFSKLKAGKFETQDGVIEFQIEAPQKFFIDKATISYCGGHIYAHSVRFSPGQDLPLLLYCDRLNLASIINQFSENRASGTGAVNGRIPLTLSKHGIKVKDGFLFSTPGNGGRISLDTKRIISDGIPLDSPALVNLAIASEALKNFEYDWIRILLNSQEDDLACKIEANGRPVGLLPFSFDSNRGYFFKDNQGPGADFKGIEFEFNILLPIGKVFDK